MRLSPKVSPAGALAAARNPGRRVPLPADWRPALFRALMSARKAIPSASAHPARLWAKGLGVSLAGRLVWIDAYALGFPPGWRSKGLAGAVAAPLTPLDSPSEIRALRLLFIADYGAPGQARGMSERTVKRKEKTELRRCVALLEGAGDNPDILHLASDIPGALAVLAAARTEGAVLAAAHCPENMETAQLALSIADAKFTRVVAWANGNETELALEAARNIRAAGLDAKAESLAATVGGGSAKL